MILLLTFNNVYLSSLFLLELIKIVMNPTLLDALYVLTRFYNEKSNNCRQHRFATQASSAYSVLEAEQRVPYFQLPFHRKRGLI